MLHYGYDLKLQNPDAKNRKKEIFWGVLAVVFLVITITFCVLYVTYDNETGRLGINFTKGQHQYKQVKVKNICGKGRVLCEKTGQCVTPLHYAIKGDMRTAKAEFERQCKIK
ncbi:MAG: hypothetical protein ACI4V7_02365 [Succinivibrionaceae bacterium]